jgi:hypothetical protein
VFAVITTVVKYVRTVLHQTGHFARHNSTKLRCQYARYCNKCTIQMINLKGQDIAKTFHHEREPMSWHTSSNLFDRFDLYFYVDIYYGTYERHAPVQLLPRYQRYRRLYCLRTNGTDPPVPLRWSVCEHWSFRTQRHSHLALAQFLLPAPPLILPSCNLVIQVWRVLEAATRGLKYVNLWLLRTCTIVDRGNRQKSLLEFRRRISKTQGLRSVLYLCV